MVDEISRAIGNRLLAKTLAVVVSWRVGIGVALTCL